MANREVVSSNPIALARDSLLDELIQKTGEKWRCAGVIEKNQTTAADGRELNAVFVEQIRLGLLVEAGILANGGMFPLDGLNFCASCWVKGPNFDEARKNGEIAGFEDKAKQLAYAASLEQ